VYKNEKLVYMVDRR